jgi:hypothetical protein
MRPAPEAAPASSRFGQWRGKALVPDPRDGKMRSVSVDVMAQAPDRLRVDATGSVGAYIGTFATARGRFWYLSSIDRIFMTGAAQSQAARDTLRMSIEPTEAIALLLDSPMPPRWSCEPLTPPSIGRRCHNDSTTAQVERQVERGGEALRIEISALPRTGAPAQLRLDSVRSGGEPDERQFRLEKPRGFVEQSAAAAAAAAAARAL